MKLIDVILILLVALAVGLAVRRVVVNKKSGKSCSACGQSGSCCHCYDKKGKYEE